MLELPLVVSEDSTLRHLHRSILTLALSTALFVPAFAQTAGARLVGPTPLPPPPTPRACVAGDPLVSLDARTRLYTLDGNPPAAATWPQPMWSPTSWSEVQPASADADAATSNLQRVCKSEADAMGAHLTQGVRVIQPAAARPRPSPTLGEPRRLVPRPVAPPPAPGS